MGIFNRETAFGFLQEHVETKRLLKHSFAVEAAMRQYAKIKNEDVERWGACGLLHDIDFEKHPDNHPGPGLDWLKEYGFDEEFVAAVKGHGADDFERNSDMAKTLYAVDELASFVIAAALVRPTKFEGLKVKSIKKKLKDKAFAAAVSRDGINKGAEEIGIEITEHIQNVIDGLVAHEEMLKELGWSLID